MSAIVTLEIVGDRDRAEEIRLFLNSRSWQAGFALPNAGGNIEVYASSPTVDRPEADEAITRDLDAFASDWAEIVAIIPQGGAPAP